MSVGLPFWLLFGSQKVTIEKNNLDEKTKQENKVTRNTNYMKKLKPENKVKKERNDEFRAEENLQNLFSSPPDNFSD